MVWPASNESEAVEERRADASQAASLAIAATGADWRRWIVSIR